jgi:choline dehydrogenase
MLANYDYVIIGGGTAGSVLTARLSEADVRVLLLEAGPVEAPDFSYPMASFPRQLLGSAIDWGYFTVPQAGTNGTVHVWSRGKVLGGSSTINAMAHIRGHRANYDGWAAARATGWSYGDLLPCFKRSETALGRDPLFRGMHGPLRVAPMHSESRGAQAFRQAVIEGGHPSTDDINGEVQVGVFRAEMNIVDGRRQSAADAYLRPTLNRANLDVIGGAVVHRLRFENSRCVAVEFAIDDVVQSVRVEREAVVAAGAIGSPQLLLLSGIGPAEQLEGLGIPVVVNLPGVGQNLQDHIQSRVIYSSKTSMHTAENGFCQEIAMLRSELALNDAPDMYLMLMDFPAGPMVADHRFASSLPEEGYTLAFSQYAPPASRGSIRLAGSDPELAPIIDPCYYAEDSDLRAMTEYLSIARSIGEANALDPWRGAEIMPGPTAVDGPALRDYLRRSSGTSFHPAGTCRIGTDSLGVVDSDLCVHGVTGLRVTDASIMPDIVSANLNATVVAIAERIAEWIKAEAAC